VSGPLVADWDGVRNGRIWTMKEKAWARRDAAMPEDVERHTAQLMGGEENGHIKEMWRAGLVDVEAEHGSAQWSMTTEQADLWKRARAAGQ
jgi:hypothetical protein